MLIRHHRAFLSLRNIPPRPPCVPRWFGLPYAAAVVLVVLWVLS